MAALGFVLHRSDCCIRVCFSHKSDCCIRVCILHQSDCHIRVCTNHVIAFEHLAPITVFGYFFLVNDVMDQGSVHKE